MWPLRWPLGALCASVVNTWRSAPGVVIYLWRDLLSRRLLRNWHESVAGEAEE